MLLNIANTGRGVIILKDEIQFELLAPIQAELKKKNLVQSDLARKMGVSAESLSFYFSGENRIKFIPFLILVSEIFEHNHKIIVEQLKLFIELTTKRENFKPCLEWSIQNGETELFELALKKEKELKYGLETVTAYSLLMDRGLNKISPLDLFEKVEEMKFNGIKQMEIEILVSILSLYVFLDLRKYNTINLLSKSTLKKIEKMKKGYLKESYMIRVNEMLAISLMKEGNDEEAKHIANSLIDKVDPNFFPLPVNSMYSLLSELYVFSDYQKSLHYISKALNIFNIERFKGYKYRERMLKNTYDFIKITNNNFSDLYLIDEAETAYFLAKVGRSKEALELIKKMEEQGPLSAHQLFYKFLATGEKNDLKSAEREFYRRGDFFYVKLIERISSE